MRTKKPWVRLRRRLFGWNVRFMIYLVSIQLGTTDRQTNQTNSLTRARRPVNRTAQRLIGRRGSRRLSNDDDLWRRGWDSNPRIRCRINGFRDRPVRPLWHLSVLEIILAERVGFEPTVEFPLHTLSKRAP